MCVAGSCQHKSESPVKFTSKSCKVKKTAGFSKYTVQGGDNEIVPVDMSKLTKDDSTDDSGDDAYNGSSSAANSTATAGK